MRVQVLGTGCPKCNELAKRTEEALRSLGFDFTVEKVTDLREILEAGVLMTPALMVNGRLKSSGRVPAASEIATILTSEVQGGVS